jgi:hypothetical protein
MEQEPKLNPKIEKPELDMALLEQQVSLKIEQYKKLPIIIKAFELLDELPEKFIYHNKAHTEDVLHETILFGLINGRTEEELERNAVAASWHDVGFTVRPNNNEVIAVELFEKENTKNPLKYAKDIKTIILDTTVRKTQRGLEIIMSDEISEDVLDADLSNLGRPDFWEKREAIAKEYGIDWDNINARLAFLKDTLSLARNHKWHTQGSTTLRQEQKAKNLADMEKEIASLE